MLEIVILSSVCTIVKQTPQQFDGYKQYVATADLQNSEIISSTEVTYDNRPSRADCTVNFGDVLFAKMAGTEKTLIAKRKHQDMLFSTGFGVLRPMPGILDSAFLYHILRSKKFLLEKDRLSSGSTQRAITNKALLEMKISIPPINEQRRIAAILDKADEIKRSSIQTKELKKVITNCIFRELFGEYFTDDKYAMEIENVANFIDYRGKTPPRVQEGIPLINAKCVRPGYFLKEKIDFIEKDTYSEIMTRGYPLIGDVLFTTEGATMGYTCRIPEGFDEFSVGQRLITLQTKDNYNSIVLEFMLNSVEVQGKIMKSATGSAAKGIRSARFVKIRIPCPPIDLQNIFASIIRKIESSNLGNISDYTINLANSLTQEMLT